MPPENTRRRNGSNAVTVTGNARPGAADERMVIFCPSARVPSTASTPESQVGQLPASARAAHTSSGLAAIVDVDSYDLMPPSGIGNSAVTVNRRLPTREVLSAPRARVATAAW